MGSERAGEEKGHLLACLPPCCRSLDDDIKLLIYRGIEWNGMASGRPLMAQNLS
jgi:hypothetical protein